MAIHNCTQLYICLHGKISCCMNIIKIIMSLSAYFQWRIKEATHKFTVYQTKLIFYTPILLSKNITVRLKLDSDKYIYIYIHNMLYKHGKTMIFFYIFLASYLCIILSSRNVQIIKSDV